MSTRPKQAAKTKHPSEADVGRKALRGNGDRIDVSEDRHELWPYRPLAAIIAALAILVVLGLLVVLLRASSSWPDPRADGVIVVAVVVVSVLPVLLLVIQLVAERGGEFEFRGLRLDFARVSPTAPSVRLPGNLDAGAVEANPMVDSGRVPIMSALREARSSPALLVDLEAAGGWWRTRLFVLAAGAARLTDPPPIAFIAGTGRDNFIGWARPAAIRDRLAAEDPELETAMCLTVSDFHRVIGLRPTPNGGLEPTGLPPNFVVLQHELFPPGSTVIAPDAFERILLTHVGQHEQRHHQREMSVGDIHRVLGQALNRDYFERTDPPDAQVRALLAGDAEWIAVTHDRSYRGLVSRAHSERAVLLALATPATQSPS